MPAFSTHYIFAKEMMPMVKETADFEVNENAVFIGTQGPDIFFFHRNFPWQRGKSKRAVGSAFHRAKFGNVLNDFRAYCETSEEAQIAKSYVLGFILHYALDSTCHPYVYSIQDSMTAKYPSLNHHAAHNIIELSIDSVMLHNYYCIRWPKKFETVNLFNFTDIEKAEIARVFESAGAEIAPLKFSAHDAEVAIEDTKSVQKTLYDPKNIKENIIKPLETLAGPFTGNFRLSAFLRTDDLENAQKYVNINHGVWASPYSGEKSSKSFYDLFDDAKEKATRMMGQYLAGVDGYEITHNISFLTGVEVE